MSSASSSSAIRGRSPEGPVQVTQGRRFYGPAELLAVEDHEPRWAIPNLALMGNVTILFGTAGCGKTTLMWEAIISNALGRPFLNAFPFERPQRFLVYDWEQNLQQTKRLLLRLGLTDVPEGDSLFYCLDLDGIDLASADGREAIRQDAQTLSSTCLIFDSRTSAFGYIDENEGKDIAQAMDPLKRLATSLDLAIVILAHEPKVEYRGGLSKLRGHGGWADKSDQLFRYHQGGDLRVLEHTKPRGVDPCQKLFVKLVRKDDGSIRLEATTVDERKNVRQAQAEEKASADRGAIERFLDQQGPQTKGGLLKDLKLTKHGFQRALAGSRVKKEEGHRGRYCTVPASDDKPAA